jgi:predicted phosphodiesterase
VAPQIINAIQNMKLLVLSDLHLEASKFCPPAAAVKTADVIVLAGDIHTGTNGIRWARSVFGDKTIVYVAGNHEYWQGDWVETLAQMRGVATELGVSFLENDVVTIQGVRFLGCTLWSDFEYFGEDSKADAIRAALNYSPDYNYITAGGSGDFLTPQHQIVRHQHSRAWLASELEKDFDGGSTVVVTHHFAHKKSVHPQYASHLTTAAYGSRLPEDLLRRANLLIHGHTHSSANYRIGDSRSYVRVICNPRGLPFEWFTNQWENENFNPGLLIEQITSGNWAQCAAV